MLGDKNCHMAIRVEIGMRDCLRNNDIYYGGLICDVTNNMQKLRL